MVWIIIFLYIIFLYIILFKIRMLNCKLFWRIRILTNIVMLNFIQNQIENF